MGSSIFRGVFAFVLVLPPGLAACAGEAVAGDNVIYGARLHMGLGGMSSLYPSAKAACEEGWADLHGNYPFKATHAGPEYGDYTCVITCQATTPATWISDCGQSTKSFLGVYPFVCGLPARLVTTVGPSGPVYSCDLDVVDPAKTQGSPCDCARSNETSCVCPPVGNPVHPGTGNKYQEETDYVGSGPFPLVWRRTYNSTRLGRLRPGQWTSSYSQSVERAGGNSNANPTAAVSRPDGKILRFTLPVQTADPGLNLTGDWTGEADVTDDLEPLLTFGETLWGYGLCQGHASHAELAQCLVAEGYCPGGMTLISQADPTHALYQCHAANGLPTVQIPVVGKVQVTLTGWKYRSSRGDVIEQYDAEGKLISLTNRAGFSQVLTYSDASTPAAVAPAPGLLVSVTDPFGRQLHFSYDAQKRLIGMTDPAGGSYSYVYDAYDNLTSVTYPTGETRLYHHEDVDRRWLLTGITDENGDRFATYAYDAEGRAISTEHAGGAEHTELTYNANGTTTVTDAIGTARTFGFVKTLGVARNTAIGGLPCSGCGAAAQSFDSKGRVASRTDWNGGVSCFAHDARGLETARVEGWTGACPASLTATSVPAALPARKVTTEWHPIFRLPTRVAEPLRITTHVYHGDGGVTCGATGALCSTSVQATADATGALGFGAPPAGAPRAWTYEYNPAGQVITADGPRTDVDDVTHLTYDAQGNLLSVTGPLGHTTSFPSHDAHGNPLVVVDPNGLTTTLAYDARQRLTSRDAGGEMVSHEHDGVGQLTKVTLPDGSFLQLTYDAAHRRTEVEDNLGNRRVFTLDGMGNRALEQVFNPQDTLVQTRSRVFDGSNRLLLEIGAQGQTTHHGHDAQGNVTSVTDPLGRVTTWQYDALHRRKQGVDPASGTTKFKHDGLGQLVQVTDARNLVTGYLLDGHGDLLQQSSPDTGVIDVTRDAAGNVLTRTDAKGQVTTYVHDALGRPVTITHHDGSKEVHLHDQGPNGIGRLTSITELDPSGEVARRIAYSYDPRGRVITDTRTVAGVDHVTAYSHDAAGRLTSMTYPSGRTVQYSLDAAGRIAAMSTSRDGDTKPLASAVSYHPFGGVNGFTFGNGQTHTRPYDLDGRVAGYTLGASSYEIGFDAASRITFLAEEGDPAGTRTYGHDLLDRLVQAAGPAGTFGYSYDATGNRLSRSVCSNTDSYSFDPASNRLASVTLSSGSVRAFLFDENGSTTADGVRDATYDARGRLAQVTTAQGLAAYQVNALGQRVAKTVTTASGAVTTIFHHDTRGRLIAESDASGAVKREYFYLNDLPIGVIQ